MEDRFQQFETALQQAIGTLQRSEARATASDARVASLEGFAAAASRQPPQQQPPPPPNQGVPMVDMRALGKPATFSGDREVLAQLELHDESFRSRLVAGAAACDGCGRHDAERDHQFIVADRRAEVESAAVLHDELDDERRSIAPFAERVGRRRRCSLEIFQRAFRAQDSSMLLGHVEGDLEL